MIPEFHLFHSFSWIFNQDSSSFSGYRNSRDTFLVVSRYSEITIHSACREILKKEFSPVGYNIGFNVGEEAGQTGMHCK